MSYFFPSFVINFCIAVMIPATPHICTLSHFPQVVNFPLDLVTVVRLHHRLPQVSHLSSVLLPCTSFPSPFPHSVSHSSFFHTPSTFLTSFLLLLLSVAEQSKDKKRKSPGESASMTDGARGDQWLSRRHTSTLWDERYIFCVHQSVRLHCLFMSSSKHIYPHFFASLHISSHLCTFLHISSHLFTTDPFPTGNSPGYG